MFEQFNNERRERRNDVEQGAADGEAQARTVWGAGARAWPRGGRGRGRTPATASGGSMTSEEREREEKRERASLGEPGAPARQRPAFIERGEGEGGSVKRERD